MKKALIFIFAAVLILSLFGGCGKKEVTEFNPPPFEDLGDNNLDVLELKFKGNKPEFTDIGEISDGVYRLNKKITVKYVNLVPEYLRDENGDYNKTGVYIATAPDYYHSYVKNSDLEGIIIYKKAPFALYYNDDNELYVRSLIKNWYDSYFKEDRSYEEFLNFAVNYEIPEGDSDTLSTSGGRDGC